MPTPTTATETNLAGLPPADPWLSPRECAAHAGVCVATIVRAIRRGDCRGARCGRVWRVRLSWLDGWLESQEWPASQR